MYTDTASELSLFIPENDNTYYYTPERTNLFEDLLEQIQNSGQDVRVLVRTYSDANVLGYSLQINAVPLPGAPPAKGGAPEGTVFLDATQMPPEEQDAAAQAVRQTYENRFNFSAPVSSVWNGLPALQMDGTGIAETDWAPYDCQAYIVAAQDHLITITLIVEHGGAYRNAAMNMLNTIAVGEAALAPAPADDTQALSETETTASSSEQTPPGTESPAATHVQTERSGGRFIDTLNGARPIILAVASVAALAIIIVLVTGAVRRKRQSATHRQSPAPGTRSARRAVAGSAGDDDAEIPAPADDNVSSGQTAASATGSVQGESAAETAAGSTAPEETQAPPEHAEPAEEAAPSLGDTQQFAPIVPDDTLGDTKVFTPVTTADIEATDQPPPEADDAPVPAEESAADTEAGAQEHLLAYAPPPERKEIPTVLPKDDAETAVPNVTHVTDSSDINKEDSLHMASNDSRYIVNGHDYTEDVSRYTQQPGPEVNDVSRFTHGVSKETDDDLQSLMDLPAEPRRSRPSVGSRVARNQSRSKRKK